MVSPSTLYPKQIDLTTCDKEPIHLLGKIQSHGMLFVLDKKRLQLVRVSENVFDFFSQKREELESLTFLDFLGKENEQQLLDYAKAQKSQPLKIRLNNEGFIVIPHYTEELIYFELERTGLQKDMQIAQYQLSEIISELSGATSAGDMCDQTVVLIKDLLGYDRVMLYQFDENWNGKVIAESKENHLDSWLGMHYPATDIPQQARKLFLTQGVRIISDVAGQAVPIYPALDVYNKPLDLSRCETRAVSPIHIEYLVNMGVGATLTAAIISNGALWGLIACHHYSPKFINIYERASIKFLTQVFSTQLSLRSSNEVLTRINDTNLSRSILVKQMSKAWDVHDGLSKNDITMLDITEATGGAVFLENQLATVGNTPAEEDVRDLVDWLFENRLEEDTYTTQNLSKKYSKGSAFAKIASGVLCVFITKSSKDCLLWFKPELKQTISWGGDPDKPLKMDAGRISPRKSFDRWNKEQERTSLAWMDYEIASALALKESIASIIIKKYSEVKELNEKLKEAYKELESFSYSVSHDLRAPLRGIDGFAQIIKEDYFESLDEYGKSAIQTIIKSTNKMNELIDDILAFSGLGKEGVSMETFSMRDTVHQVIDFLQVKTLYPEAQIEIYEDLPDAYGDSGMISQLLNNLIGNALKYSKRVKSPVITIGAMNTDEGAVYFVKDNGIGFNNEHSTKIFGVFNRLVKDEFEGSGIGLAISKRVVDKHKGKIWAESKENDGAAFYFQLP